MGANKAMEMKDIAAIDDKDLVARIASEKVALGKAQFAHAVSSSENPLSIRTKRRDIARMLTHLNARKATK
jgi:large subunit ribosomal protein L29